MIGKANAKWRDSIDNHDRLSMSLATKARERERERERERMIWSMKEKGKGKMGWFQVIVVHCRLFHIGMSRFNIPDK